MLEGREGVIRVPCPPLSHPSLGSTDTCVSLGPSAASHQLSDLHKFAS